MKLEKLALGAAVAAACGIGMAGNASATAMAQSLLTINNFTITNGTSPLTLADFSELSFLDSLNNTAVLTPGGSAFQNASSTTFSATPIDAPQACVGTGCPAENTFTPAPVPPTATYSRSDSLLSGAPINGTPAGPAGVDASAIAQTSLFNTNANGSSTSDILLTSTFQFMLDHPVADAGFTFNADTFLQAYTAPGSVLGTSAGAGFKWEITLVDGITGDTLIDWIPNGNKTTGTQTGLTVTSEGCTLVANASATFNQPSGPTQNCMNGSFAAVSDFVLLADHPYSFTIDHHVSTQASEVEAVPEPATLALLSMGMIGLGWVSRKRKNG